MVLSESFALDATPINNRQWPPSHVELIRHQLNNSSENWKTRSTITAPRAHRGYGEHFDAQSSHHRLVLGCAHTIGRLTAALDKEARTVVLPAKAGLIFPCMPSRRPRLSCSTANESSEYSSRKHAVTAKSSGEQSTSNLNCDKQRPEPQHSCKRDGRCKFQGSLGRSARLRDHATSTIPQPESSPKAAPGSH
jgi:hypothetical protein